VKADIVHVNDLIEAPKRLDQFQILAIPGGFSYGDDTGSGNAMAWKMKNSIWESLMRFVENDRLVIGICNGCQVLVNLGLVPGLEGAYGKREVALLPNISKRYIVRWTDLENLSLSPWLRGIDRLSLPIAHGEGVFYMRQSMYKRLVQQNLVALRYVAGEMWKYQGLPVNPTGTMANIAAISDTSGRVLAIMPHPERALWFTQRPDWPLLAQKLKRQGKRLPKYGPGWNVFANSMAYFG
jgi:phosphoribosylformylglycinamidine synthase